jgi:hypothetical protein
MCDLHKKYVTKCFKKAFGEIILERKGTKQIGTAFYTQIKQKGIRVYIRIYQWMSISVVWCAFSSWWYTSISIEWSAS